MLYNRIAQKKREMHKATERAVTDKIWTEIETLQWVLGQSLNVRRQMEPNEGRILLLITSNNRKKENIKYNALLAIRLCD